MICMNCTRPVAANGSRAPDQCNKCASSSLHMSNVNFMCACGRLQCQNTAWLLHHGRRHMAHRQRCGNLTSKLSLCQLRLARPWCGLAHVGEDTSSRPIIGALAVQCTALDLNTKVETQKALYELMQNCVSWHFSIAQASCPVSQAVKPGPWSMTGCYPRSRKSKEVANPSPQVLPRLGVVPASIGWRYQARGPRGNSAHS